MENSGSPLRALPHVAWQPTWQKYGTWAVLALLGIALTDGALFLIHDRAAGWVDHSRAVIALAHDARLRAADRRAAIDVFITSRDPALLTSDARARRNITNELDSLVTLTADNASQQRGARAIAQAYREWDSTYAAPALASKAGGAALKASGPALFAPLSERFAEFIAAEDVLYQSRRDRDRLLSLLTLVATALPIALLAAATLSVRRRLQAKRDAILDQQAQLEEQAIELEAQVEELEISNKELTEANAETERARDAAERALAERDRVSSFLDTALQSSPIGFAFLDTNLRYVRVNARLADARQLQPEDFAGNTVMEMASTPAAGATAVANIRHVMQTGKPVLDGNMLGLLAGEQRRYLINYFPIRNALSELTGVGMVVTDITERSALEEQYRQSQKMEALGRLAGGVAHDFRNLLTVIRSYCDLVMLETGESDPRRNELLEIRGAADRAANLARQLLTFGRPQPLLAVELDVNDGVRAVEGMLKRTAPDTVKVEMRLATHLGKVLVDPGHVEQVLMNLAINAIDAMPDGGRLTFETANAPLDEKYTRNHPGVAPGQYIMLSVSDTGVGMDDATLARIYEPFFTTKPPGKGTGLGLATVYGIVTQCGGHCWVYSEPGQGTTFKIYFPRLVPTGVGAADARLAKREPVRAESAETVLVVEDDFAVRGSLTRILKRFGYQVLEAEHGADALRVARAHDGPIHLAISDLMMPEMSGREFGEQLGSARPETRVLFMSGYTDEDVLQRGLVGEHQAFIQKPFAIEDITRKVHDVLRSAV